MISYVCAYLDEKQLLRLYDYLMGDDACNWTDEGWICFGDLRFTLDWLYTNKIQEVDACIDWFELRGGYCDCEVILNILSNMFDDESEE